MSDIIDLDALAPEAVTVKLGNEEIKILPPSLADVMRLGALSQKLGDLTGDNLDDASAKTEALTAQIFKCVPALEGKQLNTAQLIKLVQIITEMATPPDAKELKERGIELGGDDTEKKGE